MPSSTSGIKDGTDLCIPNTFSAEASAEPFFSRVEYNIELQTSVPVTNYSRSANSK